MKKNKNKTSLSKFYGDKFYRNQMDGSLKAGIKYSTFFCKLFKPKRIIDIGCGRGAWLFAFKKQGAKELVGYDGFWNKQENMIDNSISFKAVELNKPIKINQKFDLAMSLEVAEHLHPASANQFIKSLTNLSDVVIFGAAFVRQGGKNHLNEQPHTYWGNIFFRNGYLPYDLFRPVFWGDNDIPYWYQQNTFLFIKKNSIAEKLFKNKGCVPMKNIAFMDCVHPILYQNRMQKNKIKKILKRIILNPLKNALNIT